MKTLQEQYNLIKEGKGHKDVFLKTAKAQFPQNVTNFATYEEATNILKQKGIISENIGGLVTNGITPDWHKIFNENVKEDTSFAFSNQELNAKSPVTNKSIMDVYNLISEVGDIDFVQEIGFAISYKDWNNRKEFANKQKIYKEISQHLDDEIIINDLEEELYQQLKRGNKELNEYGASDYFENYEDAKKYAEDMSSKEGIVQHVNEVPSGGFKVSDWYDDDTTLASYESGIQINETLNESKDIKAKLSKTDSSVLDKEIAGYDYKDKDKTDNVYGTLFLNGFYAEINDPKNKDKNIDEIKNLVTKNLSKDRLYYVTKAQFGIKDIGYTTEAPGLGTSKESKGKYKSSGYGDIDTDEKSVKIKSSKTDLSDKEAKTTMPKKVEEMPIAPKSLRGIKKMANWGGKEKKIKLKEGEIPDENRNTYYYVSLANDMKKDGKSKEEIKQFFKNEKVNDELVDNILANTFMKVKEGIGMFHDPIGFKKPELSDIDKIFTKEYRGNGLYAIYKNGEYVKTIDGEGNANAYINNEKRKLKEGELRSLIRNIIKEELNEYGEDSGGQDMTYGMYSRSSTRKDQGNQDFIDKGKYDFYDDVPFEACPYEDGFNKYYNADLAKLWQMGWKEAKAEAKEELGESYDYETQKDLAQLIRGAYQIEPQSMKYTLDIMKSPNINVTNAGEIVTNYFKNKNITDSDIISSTMDKVYTKLKNSNINENKLRKAIRTLINEELNMKEIDEAGKMAEYQAKSKKINEEIAKRRKKLKALTTLEEIEVGSTNPKLVKELKKEIQKLEKIKEKLDKKYTPKEGVIDEDTTIYTSDGTENTATSIQKTTAKKAGSKGDTVVYKKKGT